MNIIRVLFTGHIEWRIHKDDPPLFPLSSLPGLSLVNPLLYPELGVNEDIYHYPFSTIALYEDSILLKTGTLFFTSPSAEDEAHEILFSYLPDLLMSLRLVSKQVGLARIYGGGSDNFLSQGTALPDLHFPDSDPNSSRHVANYRLNAAVTTKHLEQADNNILHHRLPIYSMALLDAVHAFFDRDDRRTIIYAAMSIELISENKLGNPTGKGPRKETTIAKRLHRQAMELLGRSLQQDNLTLYQTAEKLYRTRNKLVHKGSILATDDLFQIDGLEARMTGKDAMAAIRCASEVFRWFGETDNFVPKKGNQVVSVPVGAYPLEGPFPKILPRLYYGDE